MTLIRNFAHWFKRASASTTLRDARPHNNDLPKPEIEGLTRYDEVDLLALGTDTLRTYINYPGIKAGDLIFPRWVGAAPSGESFDYFRDPFRVPSGVDPTVGVLYTIGNDEVQSAAGGWAFYSYQLHEERPDMESMRRFCYVGVRPRPSAETLSVALAAPSHDLVVAWRALGASMALVIPPYQAMQPGDRVAITLTGKNNRGDPITWKKTSMSRFLANICKPPLTQPGCAGWRESTSMPSMSLTSKMAVRPYRPYSGFAWTRRLPYQIACRRPAWMATCPVTPWTLRVFAMA